MAQQKSFYFSEGQYLQTLQGLHAALTSQEAFVKLLGSAQTGKSQLCEKLAQYMRRKGFQVVHFNSAVESPDMLRNLLARELKLPVSSNFARLLEDTLQPKDDHPIVLIFDDAHLLTDVTLLEIYRLAEVQVQKKRVLNILLCGEMSLEKRLLSNQEFKSLLLSVTNRFILEPMDKDTLAQFFYRYAEKCGVPGLQLEAAAMNYFYKSCRGYPGPALSLCRILVDSRLGNTDITPISKGEISLLLKNNSGLRLPGNIYGESQKFKPLMPVAAVVVIASIGFLYQQLNPSEGNPEPPGAGQSESSPFTVPPSQNPDIEIEQQVAQTTDPAVTIAEPVLVAQDTAEPDPGTVASTGAQQPAAQTTAVTLPPEVAEPVSDSSLALVTAEEIGITDENISQPVYESLESTDTNSEEVEVAEDDLAGTGPDPGQGVEADQPLTAARNDEQGGQDEQDEQDKQIEQPEEEPGPEPALVATVVEDIAPETVEAVDTVQNRVQEVQEQAQAGDSMVVQLESAVRDWLDAWQSQSINDYFDSYHSEFEPRYQDSVQAWRANRQRVIGNAASISLELSDFEHLGTENGMQDVRFWLRYASPNYSDNTQKKLLMLEEEGRWKILEEINLQVRR